MKILLDKMCAGLKEYLEIRRWEVLTVQDVELLGAKAKDKDIVEYAKKNNLLLVTHDQKMVGLCELTDVKYVAILQWMIAKILDAKIREKYPGSED